MPTKSKTFATQKDAMCFDDMRRLYIRARAHSRTEQKEGIERRIIEAFLLQTAILEGSLVNLGLKMLEKRPDLSALKGKRGKWYDYDNAINDLYLLGEIDTDEFKKLEQFKSKRNEYVHNLLSESAEIMEGKMLRIYREYNVLVWTMIKKFRRRIGRIPKVIVELK